MPYFKDETSKVFWLDETDNIKKWVRGRELITEEEAQVIIKAAQEKIQQELMSKLPSKAEQIAQLQAQIDALKA